MHNLEEFEAITNEVLKNPNLITEVTKETVELAEKQRAEQKSRARAEDESVEFCVINRLNIPEEKTEKDFTDDLEL